MPRDVYRIVETRCRFCGCELRLKIHEQYDISDPHRLVAMAACNRCADLRELRRKLHFRFSEQCAGMMNLIERSKRSMTESERKEVTHLVDKTRENIESLIKAYLRLIGDWYNRDDLVYEEEMVNWFMQAPMGVSKHIARLWRCVPQQKELLKP